MFKASRRRFGTAEAARRCGPRRQKRRPSEPPRGRQKESGAKFSESTSEMQRDARVHCTPLKILHPAAYMRRYMKCDCVWTPPFSASSPTSCSFTPANCSQTNAFEQGKGAHSAKALFSKGGSSEGGSSEGGSSKSMAPAPRTAGTSAFLARMLQQYGTGSHISE